jgi:hypothetical protein
MNGNDSFETWIVIPPQILSYATNEYILIKYIIHDIWFAELTMMTKYLDM